MPLQIEARQERSITVIQLQGDAADGDASRLQGSLTGHLAADENKLVLEVSGLGQVDTPSILVLLDMQAGAEQTGGDLRLAGAGVSLLARLAVSEAEQKFAKFDTVDAALTSFDGIDSRGVKHFDILEFVKEQEREEKAQYPPEPAPQPASTVKD